MKKLHWIFLALLLMSGVSFARIGETLEQCKARYGDPVESSEGRIFFNKGPIFLLTMFYHEKCDYIMFGKLEKNELGKPIELTENEIEVILKANGGNQPWKSISKSGLIKSWATADGKIRAEYEAFENKLSVYTIDFFKRNKEIQQKEEKESLSGF